MAAEAIGLGTLVSHTLVSQHTLRHSFVARLCSCHGNLKPAGSNCCIPARRDRHYLGVVLDHLVGIALSTVRRRTPPIFFCPLN